MLVTFTEMETYYNKIQRQEWAREDKETKRILLEKKKLERRGHKNILKLPRTQYDRFADCFRVLEGEDGTCSFLKFNHAEDTITFEMYEVFRADLFLRTTLTKRSKHLLKFFTLENINKISV